ncbi:MAG TPA: penicillin-binding transpeptidase domain-containing protein [Candidatus Omnitrophota bacterium]|nr:penicillin-binding transpeptidase domain-containing protein [Candidatus Omnitrophota bacterium]HPD85098.1 penicillin-binding transpeptidase domain-containing protein [Candidatus Omnitrophota bacterium]HRZ03956.1 penicillin-binding transpeptidase domain-containing protein [Candidatus Omnitrophota bacterium]
MHIRKYPLRFCIVFLVFILALCFCLIKLILIQVFKSSYLDQLAEKQHNYFIKLEPKRGAIYDRNLHPLAINVAAYSLYANPKMMKARDKEKAVGELSVLLGLEPDFIRERLDKDKYFVWLERKLPLTSVQKIKNLKIAGLDFIKESRRHYPNQALAAQLIGFAGMDNEGLEGLELKYNKYLKGEFGWTQILKDAKQRALLIEKSFIPPKDGFDVVLTIDETIQYIAERALDKAFVKHRARGAMIIVINPKTGEILALANRPTFDLMSPTQSDMDARRDRAVADMYEPGSVFKIVTAAAALEEGKVSEQDKFFCENGTYRVGNHILHDHQKHGTLTFSQVIEQSSNIGVTKVAQLLGPSLVYKYAQLFRFGMPTGINIPGEVNGVLKPPSVWSKTSIGAIPIGHEVTVTAIQLGCAIAAIANDGVYMKPFVVKYIKDQKGEIIEEFQPQTVAQVISKNTADRLKVILTRAVEDGTGKLARIKNVKVAGKTGTAQKVVGGVYSHNSFYASFIGFAPADNPKIAMVVIFDEPHLTYYGGTVSAPVFKEVAQDVLRYLDVTGNDTVKTAETGTRR